MTTMSQHPHIDEVTPFAGEDVDCLREIREVLERHDRLGRFGVTLLHSHFNVAPDEVLVETASDERTLTVAPVKTSELPQADGWIGTTIDLSTTPLDGDVLASAGEPLCRYVTEPGTGPDHKHADIGS
jgi:hypothetical protein